MWWFYPLLSGRLCGLEKQSLNLSIHRRCWWLKWSVTPQYLLTTGPSIVNTVFLEIPEYWIIDPAQGKITVSTLREGRYDDEVFKGDDAIHADIFPQLVLTARPIPGATLSP